VAELDDHSLLEKIGWCEAEGTEAEAVERGDEPVGVLLVDPDPYVDVLGEPGVAVGGDCVPPTIKKRTSCAAQDAMNSLESRFSSICPPVVLAAQFLKVSQALCRRAGAPVCPVGVGLVQLPTLDHLGDRRHVTSLRPDGRVRRPHAQATGLGHRPLPERLAGRRGPGFESILNRPFPFYAVRPSHRFTSPLTRASCRK
jgi:hypothetical protein